ncbi:porin [Paraburkholderia elongata]|uniref:Porin n=1 Tax=Paraburkholderia elongata TaxID=2675747 RepID=A0A972NL85_9BURK|nr:porin [Paraburkholderia elongata]NPT53630.1 porin [Paraburkholderia elongata]
MKLSKAIILATGGLASASVCAQSSVTLYGLVDAGISYVNNLASQPGAIGARKIQETSGVGAPSRWGIRGVEDLGGGNSAIFVLENGFSVATGTQLQGSRLFGRQAFVGLANKNLGTATFGRQYDSVVDFVGPFVSSRQWATQYGAHVGDIDNLYTTFRINNSVKYTSPTYRGLAVGGLYAFSNQAAGSAGTGFSNNSAWSVGASYAAGAVTLGAGHLHLSNPSAGSTGGSNTAGAIVGDYTSATDIFYTRPVRTQDVTGAGIAYQWHATTLGFAYTFAKLQYVDRSSFSLSNYEANASYQISPAVLAGVAFIYSDGKVSGASRIANITDGTHPRWAQINAGAEYLLSKRSTAYVAAVYQKALGDALTASIDNVGGPTGSNSRYQLAVTAGLRVKF